MERCMHCNPVNEDELPILSATVSRSTEEDGGLRSQGHGLGFPRQDSPVGLALRSTEFSRNSTAMRADFCAMRTAWRSLIDWRHKGWNGGGRGIRTPGTVSRTSVFKTDCFNRSHIPPRLNTVYQSEACARRNESYFVPFG